MRARADAPVLVTGGAGFIGCNLADRLAAAGHAVLILDSLARPGVEANLHWLRRRHPGRVASVVADIRDDTALRDAVARCRAIFHLAAQVAVTTSLVDPLADLFINVGGTARLLDYVRTLSPDAPVIFASTNKVYGDLADVALTPTDEGYRPADAALRQHGLSEARPLSFSTPYGCSKGAADQYVLDYARTFGLRTAVLRMSCIYGPRQLGTEDQGWVAHFVLRALAGESIVLFGDGRQVRDILHVQDAVDAYLAAWSRIDAIAGRAFNLGGGPDNAVCLLQLMEHIGRVTGRAPAFSTSAWRPQDQRYYVSDTRAARAALGLGAPFPWRDGVAELVRLFAQRQAATPHDLAEVA